MSTQSAAVPRQEEARDAAAGMLYHTGLASALCVSAFQPFLSRVVVGSVDFAAAVGMFVVVWAAYLIDRLRAQPEDSGDDPSHSATTARRLRPAFMSLLAALCVVELLLVWQTPSLLVPVAVAVVSSTFYSVPIPLLRRRAKDVPYLKPFYLAGISVLTVFAFTPAARVGLSLRGVLVFVFAFAIYVLSYSLFDIKDIAADRAANIRTLAAALGTRRLLEVHLVVAGLVTVGVLTVGYLSAWPLAAVAIFHAWVCRRLSRRPLTPAFGALIDLGYSVILCVGTLAARPLS